MNKKELLVYLSDIKMSLEKQGVEKIGLFGSFSKDKARESSDIDVAIKLKSSYLDEHDVWEYFRLIGALKKDVSMRFSRKVDIFDLDSEGDFKKEIEKEIIYV